VVALNSECDQLDGCGPGSRQYEWLRQELTVRPSHCLLAYWHRPVFSSGMDGGQTWTVDLLELLYEAGADLLLTGDDHLYERLQPVDPRGTPDPARGVRMINVGTGGSSLGECGGPPLAATEVRDNTSHGVLRLELHGDGYEWEFVPVRTDGFRDSGADSCR
jgi:acid phosphatase type 7